MWRLPLDSAEFVGRVEDCWEDGGLCKEFPCPVAGLADSTASSPASWGLLVYSSDAKFTTNSEPQPAAVCYSLFCEKASCVLLL